VGVDNLSTARQLFGDRAGWMVQQLIKLSAPEIASSTHAFVIDADTILLRPRTFCDGKRALLLASCEFNVPYYNSLVSLLPNPGRLPKVSFVAHHMWFEMRVLRQLRLDIENHTAYSWKEAILRLACRMHPDRPMFSEYELYGQHVASTRRSARVIASHRNRPALRSEFSSLKAMRSRVPRSVYSLSLHHYLGRQ
jgi:hypothetical protein